MFAYKSIKFSQFNFKYVQTSVGVYEKYSQSGVSMEQGNEVENMQLESAFSFRTDKN